MSAFPLDETTGLCDASVKKLTFAVTSGGGIGERGLCENGVRIRRCAIGRRAIADRSVIHGDEW